MAYRSDKACAALDLAGRLTEEQGWFLMELTSIDKEDSRYFNRNELRKKKALLKGLESTGATLDGMVKSLLGGFLGGNHRGPWRKTNDGNLLGHELEQARDSLALHGKLDRILARTPGAMPAILAELGRACDHHRGEAEPA